MLFVQWLINPCLVTFHRQFKDRLILDNLKFNFNPSFGVAHVWCHAIPKCGRMWCQPAIFIWRAHIVISYCYELKKVSMKS